MYGWMNKKRKREIFKDIKNMKNDQSNLTAGVLAAEFRYILI